MLISIVSCFKKLKIEILSLFALLVFYYLFLVVFNQKFPLMNIWEGHNFFNFYSPTFTRLDKKISFLIQYGGDTSGSSGKYGYALLKISSKIIYYLKLPITFFSTHFVTILYGSLAIIFSFKLMRNFSSRRASILAAALFSTNHYFLSFISFLFPQIISILFLIILLKQLVEFTNCSNEQFAHRKMSKLWYLLTGFSIAALAIHYLPGRVVSIGLIASCLIVLLIKNSNKKLISSIFPLAIAIALAIAILFLLSFDNLNMLFSKDFIFPTLGEYPTSTNSFIENSLWNVPLFLKQLILGSISKAPLPIGGLHASVRYAIMQPAELILFLSGFGISLFYLISKKRINDFYLLTCLGLICICILSSEIQHPSNLTTMSPYRTSLLLVVIFPYISIAFDKLEEKIPQCGVLIVFFVGLLYNIGKYSSSISEFKTFINAFDLKTETFIFQKELKFQQSLNGYEPNHLSMYLYHSYYNKLALDIISKVIESTQLTLYVEEKKFQKVFSPKYVSGLDAYPYFSVVMSYYLNQNGLENYIYDKKSRKLLKKVFDKIVLITTEEELRELSTQYPDRVIFKYE